MVRPRADISVSRSKTASRSPKPGSSAQSGKESETSYHLGIDVGGTFTDLVLFEKGSKKVSVVKVPSTPGKEADGIINGITKLTRQEGVVPEKIHFFMHGTTVATNAVLTGNTAKTAIMLTEGFKDVLGIMRQNRPKLYNFFAQRPKALIPRDLRFEISERIMPDGQIYKALDEKQVLSILAEIKRQKIQSLAVCLLHSYVNPVHEQRIKQLALEHCDGMAISISSEVLPEIKEYERMSTVAINASVLPIVSNYFRELRAKVSRIGLNRTIHVMQSNGGLAPSAHADLNSATTILSGPAAGVIGGMALAKQAGFDNVITVDMGGTSFDICLVQKGKPNFTHESEVGGHALKVPMIDIHAIGAGGGSIARIDSGGILKVGPQSAGANPGPVCYGQGGSNPTVTDANLVLNRLNASYFLGGQMQVDKNLAQQAIETKLAKPLNMGVMEVAEGIIKVINASMVKGIRCVSVEKGYDPREFKLVCFGGNGPLHAVELAEELGISQIMIPFAPGANCAYGLLASDLRYDSSRTYVKAMVDIDLDEINSLYGAMEKASRNTMRADGIDSAQTLTVRSLEMRYLGQGYELDIPLANGKITRQSLKAAEVHFHAVHKRTYGFSNPKEPTEIVNLRSICMGVLPKPQLKKEKLSKSNSQDAMKGRREVFYNGKYHSMAIYDRAKLRPQAFIKGPAIIEQKDSTTFLTPKSTATVDCYGNIIITAEVKK